MTIQRIEPAYVVDTNGDMFLWQTVAAQLAGALSHCMLSSTSEMPTDEIVDIIDKFVYQTSTEDISDKVIAKDAQ